MQKDRTFKIISPKIFKYAGGVLGAAFALAAVNSGATFMKVQQEYDTAEAVDQSLHHAAGTVMTLYHRVMGKKPCQAIEATMAFAVRREYFQRNLPRQQSGQWCNGAGCQRDLRYWLDGALKLNSCPVTPESYGMFLPAPDDRSGRYRIQPVFPNS